MEECVNLLINYDIETIIIHLQNEGAPLYDDSPIYKPFEDINNVFDTFGHDFETNEYYETIACLSINNNLKKYGKLYNSFFYIIYNDTFTTLGTARGKIIILHVVILNIAIKKKVKIYIGKKCM